MALCRESTPKRNYVVIDSRIDDAVLMLRFMATAEDFARNAEARAIVSAMRAPNRRPVGGVSTQASAFAPAGQSILPESIAVCSLAGTQN